MFKKVTIFIFVNIILFTVMLVSSYSIHNYFLKKRNKKEVSLVNFLNSGNLPSFGSLFIGLTFGIIFGFLDNFGLWMGIDVLKEYMPGGELTKAAWGNTYSDFIGATIGTFIASMANDIFDVDVDDQPIWLNTVGIFIGCILGMNVGRLVTGKK